MGDAVGVEGVDDDVAIEVVGEPFRRGQLRDALVQGFTWSIEPPIRAARYSSCRRRSPRGWSGFNWKLRQVTATRSPMPDAATAVSNRRLPM